MTTQKEQYEKRGQHIPGDCWCERFHHCCHVDQSIEDVGYQEICCHCGETMPIHHLPVENHGPWAWWLYTPQEVAPEDDNCTGAKEPPKGYGQTMMDVPGEVIPVFG